MDMISRLNIRAMFHAGYGNIPAFCFAFIMALVCLVARADPPYGDTNQPYDKLPGTLETFHVKWANPLVATNDTKLKVLFILPYRNSRQVVELAQRLEMEYTVIMCAGHKRWHQSTGSDGNGNGSTQLDWTEGSNVLASITLDPTTGRLTLPETGKRYDAVVIGSVNWNMMPTDVRTAILGHLDRGSGLVYVSPGLVATNSAPAPWTLTPAEQTQFTNLFGVGAGADINTNITRGLPFDIMRIKLVTDAQYPGLPAAPKYNLVYLQQPLTVRLASQGSGQIVDLDYHDANLEGHYSLTPGVKFDPVKHDFDYAVLARAVLYAAGKNPAANVRATITMNFPANPPAVPTNDIEYTVAGWDVKTPTNVVAWTNLGSATITFATQGTPPAGTKLEYALRDSAGAILKGGTPPEGGNVTLPILARGNYTADLRVLDSTNRVLDFASKSFRVEGNSRITTVTTDKTYYEPGQTIQGTVNFAETLPAGYTVTALAIDTWNRVAAQASVSINGLSGTFSLPVTLPKSRLWDIQCRIDAAEVPVDCSKKIWVGLPDWNFDDYIWALIFSTGPDYCWKNDIYSRAIRPYGINANNVYLIYGSTYQYELTERYHMQSISYAEHMGQYRAQTNYTQECSTWCMAKWGRVANHIVLDGNGNPYLDDPNMNYQWGPYNRDASWTINRIYNYRESLKFGSPYYWLTGEEYLSCEFPRYLGGNQWESDENSCFCDYCTSNFQAWCQAQYDNNLAALTNEWNVNFTDWNQVRGILRSEAVANNQLPRWVDFRHFMRSEVWSQFFVDYTDMMRRTMPKNDIRTATNGHDHHDFSRYRTRMTSGKLYGNNLDDLNNVWKDSVCHSIRQSFSSNQSFQLGAQTLIRWTDNFKTAIDQQRLPWKFLFSGLRGFDWERGLDYSAMGGESCFTPDYSQALPFFQTISAEVKTLQRGIGKLVNTAQPVSSAVAILWAPYNHYISRILPSPPNMGKFTGSWLYNISVDGGAISDCLAMMKALRLNPVFMAPEDIVNGQLQANNIKVLLLPYSKGMSVAEEAAIRNFVTNNGGMVIADNEPGTYSEHGRALGANRRLADLFPDLTKQKVVTMGPGVAAYMPNAFNDFLTRFEANEYPEVALSATVSNVNSANWTLITQTFTIPNNASISNVGLLMTATGDVTIDDLTVTKEPANKFPNPGLELVRDQMLNVSPFSSQREGGCDFGVTNDGPVDIPSNFSQFCGQNSNFVMVADAHSGSRAIMNHGSFYFGNYITARSGDVFRVNFYGKGQGNGRLILLVGDSNGTWVGQMVPNPTTVSNTGWKLISKDLTITPSNAYNFIIRTDASDDINFDDISIQKLVTVSMANGSFEDVTYQSLSSGQFKEAIDHGWDLGTLDPAPFPTNFDRFILAGTTTGRFVTVADARTGTKALRINGSFTFTDRFLAEPGDVFTVSYYAKGNGSMKAELEMFATNGFNLAQTVGVSDLIRAAGVTPEVDLVYTEGERNGWLRQDTMTPVYAAGSARYVGMLRQAKSPDSDSAATQMKLKQPYYVYDMRAHTYLGYGTNFNITLDKQPKFYALLPAQPTAFNVNADQTVVNQGGTVTLAGNVTFGGGAAGQIGQVVHITVSNRNGAAKEMECYRDNILFTGTTFSVTLPISFSEQGVYTVTAEYPITGAAAVQTIEVRPQGNLVSDEFENYTNGTQLVNGTNGWYGSTGTVVQSEEAETGEKAILLTSGSILTNVMGATTATNIWLQMKVRCSVCTNAVYPEVNPNATAMLFINTNGNFVAHNGPVTNIYSSTNWVVLTNYNVGMNGTDWVTIGIHEDFSGKTWDLYANGTPLKTGLGFINTNITHFSGFGIYGGGNAVYVDGVLSYVGQAPAGVELPWVSKGDLE